MAVVVVGAGLAGLMAADSLQRRGHDVVVLEKNAVPGGRLATRRHGDATFDTGAQFFTVRSEAFARLVHDWRAMGLVREWTRGFGATADGYPRYAVRGGMAALAAHLAADLDVRLGSVAFLVRSATGRWDVQCGDGSALVADALVVTAPLPQAASILIAAGAALPEELRRTDYERTIALLVHLDGPSAVPAPGGIQHPGEAVSFVSDNRAKGISTAPALTVHATDAASLRWWDDVEAARRHLLDAAAPWIGAAGVIDSTVVRWRLATPMRIWPERCWIAREVTAPLVLAGDAFAGPKVEGAALSGLAAAEALA
jgi:predicted NAD/FAD-dependent oxidoreductase